MIMLLTEAMRWDLMRWVNVVLSGMVVALLVAGAVHRWEHMPKRFRRITPWVIGTYVIIAYGSGEVASSHTEIPAGLRVGFLVIDLLGLVIALLYRLDDDTYDS